MTLVPMTIPLSRRIQRCLESHHLHGIASVQRQPGNPYGIEIETFGTVTAFLSHTMPEVEWYNAIVGLDTDDLPQIGKVVEYYRSHGIVCEMETSPATMRELLARTLVELGLHPVRCDSVLYGLPHASSPAPAEGIRIQEIDPNDIDLFLEVWADGSELEEGHHRRTVQEIRKSWCSIPDESLYIAFADDIPAAIAGLYVNDNIGYLHSGATIPRFRNRGCHTALISHRLAVAASAGCEFAVGEAPFGSISQNNLERSGLQIAYTRLTWRDRET